MESLQLRLRLRLEAKAKVATKVKRKFFPLTKDEIWNIQLSDLRLFRGREFRPGTVFGDAHACGEGGLSGE